MVWAQNNKKTAQITGLLPAKIALNCSSEQKKKSDEFVLWFECKQPDISVQTLDLDNYVGLA